VSGPVGAADLWELFLEESRVLLDRMRDGARAVAVGGAGLGPAVRELASGLQVLASSAGLVGVAEIAGAAAAASRVAAEIQAGHLDPAGGPGAALAETIDRLSDSVLFLSRPDKSGARLEGSALPSLQERLEALVPLRRSVPPPAAAPSTSSGEDDTSWVPQVDEDMVDPFIDECTERLEGLAGKLLALEESPHDASLVNEIFRDLHTVKGSSGFVGLRRMNRLAHAAEDLVGKVRQGTQAPDRGVVDALLGALDALRAILERAVRRAPIDVPIDEVIARLRAPGSAGRAAVRAEDRGSMPPVAVGDGRGAGAGPAAAGGKALRVDFAKLDLLMNLVGELVLGKARVHTGLQNLEGLTREIEAQRRSARRAAQPGATTDKRHELREIADELGRVKRVFEELGHELDDAATRIDFVSDELRDQVMKLRMVPIGRVFSKYRRTVRELALGLGKKVQLQVEGAETELDKVLVEELDEPLTHLVRNAIDHGLELPEVRKKAGKPEVGTLTLRASSRGNQIIVSVEEDGAGIDPARVKRKAVENGILSETEAEDLDERRALELIFRPGFSTAAAVTDMSGRGVGMDAVRETVSRLKGTIEVRSEVGHGTRVILRLPLTLAIIKVLLVRAGGEVFALPIDVVSRTIAARREAVRALANRTVLHDRERDIPLVDLREVLGLGHAHDDDETVHVALAEIAGETYGLVCDMLLGQQEIVIKSMGDVLQEVPGAAGATLLGDRCVIILDIPAIVAMARGVGPSSRASVAPGGAGARALGPGAAGEAAALPEVLLVEDSDTIREGMKRLLEQAGYRVTEARDGAEGFALAMAHKPPFALVSTDVMMPNVDGYELTRRLRETREYHEVPIVMVTSRAEKIDRIRGFDVGVDEYIVKPLDRSELLRAVRKFLGQ
jgi:two-component system chemotaxis sensor kinase CheA